MIFRTRSHVLFCFIALFYFVLCCVVLLVGDFALLFKNRSKHQNYEQRESYAKGERFAIVLPAQEEKE